jgi:hypothetical protein
MALGKVRYILRKTVLEIMLYVVVRRDKSTKYLQKSIFLYYGAIIGR